MANKGHYRHTLTRLPCHDIKLHQTSQRAIKIYGGTLNTTIKDDNKTILYPNKEQKKEGISKTQTPEIYPLRCMLTR